MSYDARNYTHFRFPRQRFFHAPAVNSRHLLIPARANTIVCAHNTADFHNIIAISRNIMTVFNNIMAGSRNIMSAFRVNIAVSHNIMTVSHANIAVSHDDMTIFRHNMTVSNPNIILPRRTIITSHARSCGSSTDNILW